jgi:hypothetical protein
MQATDNAIRQPHGRPVAARFEETRLPRSTHIPAWTWLAIAGAAAAGPLGAWMTRGARAPFGILRGTLFGSTLAWLTTVTLDLAEHFRLEKEATGSYLRCSAVPVSESVVHAGIVLTNLSALLLARPARRVRSLADAWLLVAPGVFLALGWMDELVYHRRRAPHREDIIHTTEHLAEGIMWTALYASRRV